MPASGWKQLLDGAPWFKGEGRFPITAYSEYVPPPWLGCKPYGEVDPFLFVRRQPCRCIRRLQRIVAVDCHDRLLRRSRSAEPRPATRGPGSIVPLRRELQWFPGRPPAATARVWNDVSTWRLIYAAAYLRGPATDGHGWVITGA